MTEDPLFFEVLHADGQGNTRLNMEPIVFAESRLMEVASVTTDKAQELMSFFNDTWLTLDKMFKNLVREKGRAEAAVTDAFAEALIACTDAKIEALGHKRGSADLRKALADREPKVIKAREVLLEIEVVMGFLRGKLEAFYRAHHDVRDLKERGQLPLHPLGNKSMPPVMGGRPVARPLLDNDDPFGQDEEVVQLPPGFGKTRY